MLKFNMSINELMFLHYPWGVGNSFFSYYPCLVNIKPINLRVLSFTFITSTTGGFQNILFHFIYIFVFPANSLLFQGINDFIFLFTAWHLPQTRYSIFVNKVLLKLEVRRYVAFIEYLLHSEYNVNPFTHIISLNSFTKPGKKVLLLSSSYS